MLRLPSVRLTAPPRQLNLKSINVRSLKPVAPRFGKSPSLVRQCSTNSTVDAAPPSELPAHPYTKFPSPALQQIKSHYSSLHNAIKERNTDAIKHALAEIEKMEKEFQVFDQEKPKDWPPEEGNAFYELVMIKTGLLLDSFGIKPGQEEQEFFKNYNISPGCTSMDFLYPSPPPFHTFEEAPLIKEVEGSEGHH